MWLILRLGMAERLGEVVGCGVNQLTRCIEAPLCAGGALGAGDSSE